MSRKTAAKTSKSDATRAAILEAARQLFAQHGYDRTTVREVAARAGIDPAMVIRYFGSKDELFARAVAFDLRLPDIRSIDPSRLGEMLVRHFLAVWEGENRHRGLPLLMRSAASNPYAASKMREVFAAQVLPAVARLGDPASAPLRAGLVSTQMLGLAFCRYILKLPPVVQLTHEQIVARVGPTIQRYATGSD